MPKAPSTLPEDAYQPDPDEAEPSEEEEGDEEGMD